jgi:hypothetical protein
MFTMHLVGMRPHGMARITFKFASSEAAFYHGTAAACILVVASQWQNPPGHVPTHTPYNRSDFAQNGAVVMIDSADCTLCTIRTLLG